MNDRPSEEHLLWQELSRNMLVDTPVFALIRSTRQSADGRTSDYFVMEGPDWANVVACVPNSYGETCFIMVRQFRHGSMRVSLEFPGGVVDEGEDPGSAVARELREETGYIAERLRYLGSVNPNPAIMGNRCYTYLAEGCRLPERSEQELDENEIIDVELVPVRELLAGERAEEFDHAMMHVALQFFRHADGRVSPKEK